MTVWLWGLISGLAVWASAAGASDKVVAVHIPPAMNEVSLERPGFAIELVQLAAARAGRELAVTFLPLKRALYDLENGTGVVMFPSLFRTPAREAAFQWVAPVQQVRLRFVAGDAAIDTLEAARGVPGIAVLAGGAPEAVLTRMGFENLVHVQSSHAALEMVRTKRVTAWFTSAQVGRTTAGDDVGVVEGADVLTLQAYLAVGLEAPPEAVEAYRQAYAAMAADGTLQQVAERYGVTLD